MIRALIFDLDDTLYREHDFVASGYRAVARHVAGRCGDSVNAVFNVMMETLARQGRGAVMQAVREQFPGSAAGIDELVDIYRGHAPDIQLFPGYEGLLRQFRVSYRLGIITDGIPEVQQRKCDALGLAGLVDEILYTWQYGPERQKPHPEPFRRLLSRLDVKPEESLCVGDNMEKDCRGARDAGIRSVLVAAHPTSPVADGPADYVIDTLFRMPLLLLQLGRDDEAA